MKLGGLGRWTTDKEIREHAAVLCIDGDQHMMTSLWAVQLFHERQSLCQFLQWHFSVET